MKKVNVLFTDSSILHSDHLEEEDICQEDWVTKIIKSQGFFNYGIEELQINMGEISNGIILIDNVSCIFPDGTYVKYDRKSTINSQTNIEIKNKIFEIRLDLNSIQEQLISLKKFYLCKTDDYIIMVKDKIKEDGSIVKVLFKSPVLTLLPEDQFKSSGYVGFPIIELIYKSGILVKTDYIPPSLEINENIIMELDNLALNLRKIYLNTKDLMSIKNPEKNVDNLVLLKSIGEASAIVDYVLKNEKVPKNVFAYLCQIVGILQWRSFGYQIIFKEYDHSNINLSIKEITNIIYSLLGEMNSHYDRLDFTKNQNSFVCYIKDTQNLMIAIDPNDNKAAEWIMEARIYSESFTNEIITKRIHGAVRKIESNDGQLLMVSISNDSYIKEGENLVIFGGNTEFIKRISFVKTKQN